MNNGKDMPCGVNLSQAEFCSTKNPAVKIVLEFSHEEKRAQKDFINVLKNLYIEKLKKNMQKSGDYTL